MNIKRIYVIIFLVSIIGLIIVQYQYLRLGLNLAQIQFNKKMGIVVNDVKLELREPNQLTFLVGKAITKDTTYFSLSMDSVQDASRFFMNDFLKEKLLQQGIKTDFSYSLYTKDSVDYFKSPIAYAEEDGLLKYPITLEGYLPTLANKRLTLELQFKDLNKYFLFQLNGLTIPSILFLLVILAIIVWGLKFFYWQQNLIVTTNEFINNLTHELKTPVFSIGVASKILQDKVGDEHKELVYIIRKQVDRLKGQIDKVLELATIENRKNFMKKSVIDFKPLLLKLVSEYRELANIENVEFDAKLEGDIYFLNCESSHLENAINSVLENSKKYATIPAKIHFLSYIDNNDLIIKIKDNGIGISNEDKPKIFEKYYRVTSGDVHNVKGYGLGLHYVKRIINLHHGKIKVESKLGEGSEFIISLPLSNRHGKK